jgi:two-component system, NarL family, sensor kinase
MQAIRSISSILFHLLVTVVITSIPAGYAVSQITFADSLRQVISNQPDNTVKATTYNKLAKYYIVINPDSSWFYCEKAYALAEKLGDTEAMADAWSYKSYILNAKGNTQEAVILNEKFIKLAESVHDSARMAKGYYNQGLWQSYLSENEKALDYLAKSLAIYQAMKDTGIMIRNYNSIGLIYANKSNFDSAASYYMRSLRIAEKTGQDKYFGVTLCNLSEVYLQLDQIETARNYANRSKEINQKNNNIKGLALDFNMLGRIASEEDDFTEALKNYDQAAALYEQSGNVSDLSDIQSNIGVIYLKQKDYNRAIISFDKALESYRKINNIKGIIVATGNKAAALCEQGRYRESLALQDTVIALSSKYDFNELRKDALGNISDLYNKAGNYKKAFDYLSRYYALKDSLYDIAKTKMINDLNFKYEKEKDKAHILALKNENLQKDLDWRKLTIKRNRYLFTGLAVVALTVFLLVYFLQKAVKDKIIAEHKISQLEEEKKLLAAKSLVEGQEEERKRIAYELHDGLGVLLSATKMQFTSIRDTNPNNLPLIEKATQLLEQATGDVRRISHNMMPGLLTKLGLYEAVEDLFDNINDDPNLDVQCMIPEDLVRLPENKEIMLYRIIQEMVNNTLKHAKAKNIRFQITASENNLDLQYSDDGKGFDYTQKLESESLGLRSIQSRVDFLNGKLAVESGPGKGVRYSVRVPVYE